MKSDADLLILLRNVVQELTFNGLSVEQIAAQLRHPADLIRSLVRENAIQKAILLRWGAHPRLRLVRANVGVGWFVKGQPARKTDPGAYPVHFGITGQADLSGIIAPTGRRIEIECKTARGRQTVEQKRWQNMIERFGGLYCLARSLADADAFLLPLVGLAAPNAVKTPSAS